MNVVKITVDGGVVQEVDLSGAPNTKVIVRDYDVSEDDNLDQMHIDEYGDHYVESEWLND